MAIKQVFLLALVVVAAAAQYPAGLFPALCPNYPLCDNELLARYTPEGIPKPALALPVPGIPEPIVRVTQYPDGVHPSTCPNYPFCNVAVNADPLPGFAQRLYPAGVSPSACPGYPYC